MEQKASYGLDHSSLFFFHCPYIPTYRFLLQYSRLSLMFSFPVLPLEPSWFTRLQLCFLSYTQISVFSLRLSLEGYLHNSSSLLGISTLNWTGTKLNSSSFVIFSNHYHQLSQSYQKARNHPEFLLISTADILKTLPSWSLSNILPLDLFVTPAFSGSHHSLSGILVFQPPVGSCCLLTLLVLGWAGRLAKLTGWLRPGM